MRAGNSRTRSGGWQRVEFDLAEAGALMRKHGFLGCDDDPVACHGHRDRAGRVRRVHARYQGGWRATLVLRLSGGSSLSQALKLTIPGKPA